MSPVNPINSRYKLVIYDCDGVLLDTLESTLAKTED